MKYCYFPAFKTRVSELRGYCELNNSVKDKILPILSLTKSRKTQTHPNGSVEKKLDELKEEFADKEFILDLSTEESTINEEITKLFTSNENGYEKWVNFVKKTKETFKKLIPAIHFNPECIDDVKTEISNLSESFDVLALRLPADDEKLNNYLTQIQDCKIDKIILILDCLENTQIIYNDLNIKEELFKNVIFLKSSFPRSFPIDIEGCIKLKEFHEYLQIPKKSNSKLKYGDYGCCYPVRYDTKARGWIPRIDIPIIKDDEICVYYARYKQKDIYTSEKAYTECAKILTRFSDIRNLNMEKCWGFRMFENAKQGGIIGRSPSFWISVRMNIYMHLIVQKSC